MKRPKAIALLSGGLDSTLAILVLLRQRVEVTALTFLTHFGCDISDSSSCSKNPFPAAGKYGFKVKLCHLADKFLEIVKSPKHGHGKNMNPCIDCRILMLREAKAFMEMTGADFIVTGEVLGQRPMSQRRDTFPLIDREAGLEGTVLRPLSARLLKPTIAEVNGLVDREKLHAFSGRSRKPQMALAQDLGLTDYPAPAGGCLLTDPIYSFRLRELLMHDPDPALRDILLLQTGRHFRLTGECKAIVGRNHTENERIVSLAEPGDALLRVEHVGSPVTFLTGQVSQAAIETAASITARYSDAKNREHVDVTLFKGAWNREGTFTVHPAGNSVLDTYRIEKKKKKERQRISV